MARTNNLNNFLTDVADAIRTKKGTTDTILASDFDTEITSLPSGGGVDLDDYFNDTISAGTSSLANETGWIKVLKKFPETLTIEGTSAEYMFYYYPLSEIPDIDFSEVTNMQSVFSRSKITSLKLNVPNATSLNGCCDSCTLLTNLEINSTNLNTNLGRLVYQCTSLVDLSELEGGGVTSIYNIVYRCNNLTNFKGVKNLGESYRTGQNANYTYYTFDLSPCTALTEESLISILNNLYDIATRGCNTQSCILGATNLAKLTSEEGQTALTNAQTKGWTVS